MVFSDSTRKWQIFCFLIAVAILLCLCGPFSARASAQSGPLIESITPDAVPAGGPDTFITVKGSGFNPSSVITIVVTNPIQYLSLPTTFIDTSTLQAVIPYPSIASPGPIFVSIRNADTGASTLGPFTFTTYSRAGPIVNSVDVSGAGRSTTFTMKIVGSHLAFANVSFDGSGITVLSSSGSEIGAQAKISVTADAPFGPQTMTITTRVGSTSMCGQKPCSLTVLADTGSWAPTGPIQDTRWQAVVVRLLDGRVLVAGGGTNDARHATASAEIFDPATGQWMPTSPMAAARLNAAATLLPDGRVLVAGGSDGTQDLSSVEIFDPMSQSWSSAGSMSSNYLAVAILLSDGRVLLLHHVDANGTRPGEIFDAVHGTFQPLPATTASTPVGASMSAVLLSKGKVLIRRVAVAPTIYDPATNTYSAANTVCGGIGGTWFRLLPDARVLCRDSNPVLHAPYSFLRAFIYDPLSDTAKVATPAADGADVLLPNDLVLIGGATNLNSPASAVGPNILYDVSLDQMIPSPRFAADWFVRSMTLLDDGRVLAIGSGGLDAPPNNFSSAVFSPPASNNPAPSLSAVSASSPASSADFIKLDIRGGAFLPNSLVQIGSTKLVTLYLGSQRLVAFVPPSLRSTISAGVSAVNPGPGGGITDRVQVGFLAPAPVVNSITPNTAMQASQFTATISGQNLVNAVSVTFSPGDVTATIQPGGDASTLKVSVNVDGGAVVGLHSLTVETGSGSATLPNALRIQRSAPPSTPPLPISEVETGATHSGYAVVTPDSGSSLPQATLTFGTVQNGFVQTQAALLPDAPVNEAIVSGDVVPLIGRNLGLAVVNTGGAAASITLTLRDEDGNVVGAPVSLSLQSRQQMAKFLTELMPTSSIGGAFRGSLTIESSTLVSIVGLRFSGNAFTPIPISGIGGSQTNPSTIVFPQFAMSGGWATTLALVNTSASAITGRIDIFDQAGNPMPARLNGVTKSTFTYAIAPLGSITFAPRDSNGQSPF